MAEPAALLLAGAALLLVVALGWLALAMDSHWEQVHGQAGPPPTQRKRLRLFGSLLLLTSLLLCLRADHASMAVLVWAMLAAGGVVVIAFVLSWRPRWLRALWPRPA